MHNILTRSVASGEASLYMYLHVEWSIASASNDLEEIDEQSEEANNKVIWSRFDHTSTHLWKH